MNPHASAAASGPVYLDHAATTPLDPRVFEAMTPYFLERYGNAASRQHALGREAARAVEEARAQVAALLGGDPREIVFTSGATESNNLALKGAVDTAALAKLPRHVITARTEHHAVLDPLQALEDQGTEVTRLDVDPMGHVDLDELATALARGARLVSLMHANNEIGVLHPLAAIGALCREHGALFHTDATQSVGKLPLDVSTLAVDLISLSAHKLYGPKGVGALWLRRKGPRVRCKPLIDGGGHERGLRSGTLNVPGIVGLGAACALRAREMADEAARLATLRDDFESKLFAALHTPNAAVLRNGDPDARLPGLTNLSFAGVDAESLFTRLPEVCASSSSACTSAKSGKSHVLRALGADPARVAGSVRFSLGRTTSAEELTRALDAVLRAVREERGEGPREVCGG